jgi:hypothetical protein
MGAVMMKMMSSTSITSTRGVTLISAIESRSSETLPAIVGYPIPISDFGFRISDFRTPHPFGTGGADHPKNPKSEIRNPKFIR